MKKYNVYYIIKKNGHGYLRNMEVDAHNQKEAMQIVKEAVLRETGRNAFHKTCKAPVKTKYGMQYDGMTYTRYNEYTKSLW